MKTTDLCDPISLPAFWLLLRLGALSPTSCRPIWKGLSRSLCRAQQSTVEGGKTTSLWRLSYVCLRTFQASLRKMQQLSEALFFFLPWGFCCPGACWGRGHTSFPVKEALSGVEPLHSSDPLTHSFSLHWKTKGLTVWVAQAIYIQWYVFGWGIVSYSFSLKT